MRATLYFNGKITSKSRLTTLFGKEKINSAIDYIKTIYKVAYKENDVVQINIEDSQVLISFSRAFRYFINERSVTRQDMIKHVGIDAYNKLVNDIKKSEPIEGLHTVYKKDNIEIQTYW